VKESARRTKEDNNTQVILMNVEIRLENVGG
jgi:hypothetical protein